MSLLLSAFAADLASARTVEHEATRFGESISGPPSAVLQADVDVIAADGEYRAGDLPVKLAELRTRAQVDPDTPPFEIDQAEATADFFFVLTNTSEHSYRVDLGFDFTWDLSAQEFDANATTEFRYGEPDVFSEVFSRSAGDGTGTTMVDDRLFLPRSTVLQPGDSVERSVQVFSEALAAQAVGISFEANAAGAAEVFLLRIDKVVPVPIPLPAGLTLFLTALGGFALLHLRQAGRCA